MSPAVYEDTAAPLGTVSDAQTIDARWVAPEVAGERISLIAVAGDAIVDRKKRGTVRELAGDCHIRAGSKHIRSGREFRSFGQHRDCRSFIRSHQAWLLQQFRKVPIE